MDEEAAFLRTIVNAPEDDAPRLVYADWLEERGDPRAELLRLEVELRRQPPGAGDRTGTLQEQLRRLTPRPDADWLARLRLASTLPPGTRLDLAVVAGKPGRIEVRGGDGETALLVEGQPVALNWDDCQGSVGQYLVVTSHTDGRLHARRLAEFVAGGVDDGRPLSDQVAPLLAAFSAGTYWLVYTPSAGIGSVAVHGAPGHSAGGGELTRYYPFEDRHLVRTQARDSLDEGRVTFQRGQIQAGRRPVVLTAAAEGAWCEFVIDGHHKLEAYGRQGVRPTVLSIVRWSAPAIHLDEGLKFLPGRHPGIADYRRMKAPTAR